jgi:hypothetical protein
MEEGKYTNDVDLQSLFEESGGGAWKNLYGVNSVNEMHKWFYYRVYQYLYKRANLTSQFLS